MRLMFQDEGRFGLLGTPRRCWAPSGVRPAVGARLERKYIYAFSAVSPHDGVLDSLVLPWVNAETMSLFLAEVAQRHPSEFVVMVIDQAGWHLAGEWIVPANMRLVFLPPYSPELNPAEHLWDALREDHFANTVFADLDAVERALTQGLRALEADSTRTQSLTGFKWITSIYLNANKYHTLSRRTASTGIRPRKRCRRGCSGPQPRVARSAAWCRKTLRRVSSTPTSVRIFRYKSTG